MLVREDGAAAHCQVWACRPRSGSALESVCRETRWVRSELLFPCGSLLPWCQEDKQFQTSLAEAFALENDKCHPPDGRWQSWQRSMAPCHHQPRLTCTPTENPGLTPNHSICREALPENTVPLWFYWPLKLPVEWRHVSSNLEWLERTLFISASSTDFYKKQWKEFEPLRSDEIPGSVITLQALNSTCSFNIKSCSASSCSLLCSSAAQCQAGARVHPRGKW